MMSHAWILLALLSAFSLATSDALVKKATEAADEYFVAWQRLVFTLPFLLIFLPFISFPGLDRTFYSAFFSALPVEVITVVLYVRALKISPMSLTLPFLAVTPVVLILVSYLILGEMVSVTGAAGVLLIAAGSYILNIGEFRRGLLEPLKAVVKEKGSVLMIIVAVLYSVTSTLGKVAIEHSSALFFGATYYAALCIVFTPVALWRGRRGKMFRRDRNFRIMLTAGFFNAAMVASHMVALKLAKVSYMISVKRVSLLIGVVYGHMLFKERNMRSRFVGAALMFAGFVLIVTGG